MRNYFRKVAAHHGLQFDVHEYTMAEDPGTHDEATFYVTNLREPVSRMAGNGLLHRGSADTDRRFFSLFVFAAKVSRSISHFKCEN